MRIAGNSFRTRDKRIVAGFDKRVDHTAGGTRKPLLDSGSDRVLHYLVENKDDPITWRDVEALPYFGFVILLVIGVVRIHQQLSPVLSGEFLKAAGIVVLLGLRHLLTRSGDDLDVETAAA